MFGLSDKWLVSDEGEGTWNAIQAADHLIECENYNWIPRLETILEEGEKTVFPPFDRFAHLNNVQSVPLKQKLEELQKRREKILR